MTCSAFLKDIQVEMHDCTIIGDKGYIANSQQLDHFRQVNIQLEVPMRNNQHNYTPQEHIIKKRESELKHSSLNYVDNS